MSLKNKNLALFFTRGLSLEKWEKLGMLKREIRTYQELSKEYQTLYFFTYGSNDARYAHIFANNIKIVPKPKWISANLYSIFLPFIQRFLLKKIDIIKTNQMDGSWAAVVSKKLYGNKLIVRCGYEWLSFIEKGKRAYWKKVFAQIVEKFAYTNANKISITSSDDRDFIIKRFKVDPSKVEVIPNYIDTEKFKPDTTHKEDDRILFLGRFEDQKNLFNLVRGMKNISARLVMIGGGSQKSDLEATAKEHGVAIEFLGNISQDNIPRELNKSKIFILPSLYEGNPKALLEAMSCGLPCVGTFAPGIENVITDGVDGVLCGIDSASIHDAVARVLSNEDLSQKIGQGARSTIMNIFSLEKVLEKEISLHKSL